MNCHDTRLQIVEIAQRNTKHKGVAASAEVSVTSAQSATRQWRRRVKSLFSVPVYPQNPADIAFILQRASGVAAATVRYSTRRQTARPGRETYRHRRRNPPLYNGYHVNRILSLRTESAIRHYCRWCQDSPCAEHLRKIKRPVPTAANIFRIKQPRPDRARQPPPAASSNSSHNRSFTSNAFYLCSLVAGE